MISRRRPLAWLLFVALLFAQLANAAHACASATSIAGDGLTAFSATEKTFASVADCEEMQTAIDRGATSSPLCANHCADAAQASADTHVSVLHGLAAPLPGVVLVLPAIDRRFPALVARRAPGLARSIAPAIPILLGRFLS